jgi:hypothetical protein
MTLDSASNNDRLVKLLPEQVESFAGEAAQVRCFNHVINLTGRMVVRQFDVPRKDADDELSAAEAALLELANGCDIEEAMMHPNDKEDAEPDDDDDGWADERDTLTAEELKELNETVRPVRLILVKVSRHDYLQPLNHSPLLDTQNLLRINPLLDVASAEVEGKAKRHGI